MNSHQVLSKIQSAGFTIEAHDGNLIVTPASKLTDAQRQFIRQHKADLLELLTRTERVTVVAKTSIGRATVDMHIPAKHMPELPHHGAVVRFKLVDNEGGGTLIDPEGWDSARLVLEQKYGKRLERLWRVGEQEGKR